MKDLIICALAVILMAIFLYQLVYRAAYKHGYIDGVHGLVSDPAEKDQSMDRFREGQHQ